jgi:hypothetical protein
MVTVAACTWGAIKTNIPIIMTSRISEEEIPVVEKVD